MSEAVARAIHDVKIHKKEVDEYLDEVQYRDDMEYIPSTFALEMVNFIKLVNGVEGESHKTPILHMKMLDQLVSGKRNIINLCYRGAAKSTLMEYLIFYIAVFGELPNFGSVSFLLYVSDSIENGVKTMRKSLEYRWQNSDFLQKYLPKTRFTDVRWDFWNISGHKFTVRGYGARTGVRGTRESGKRPQIAFLDDLISDEDARSPTIIASIEDTVYKAIDYALDPTRRLILWNGTPFNQSDPLYRATESGAWAVNVYPVCEHFDEHTTEKEFHGAWPDRHTYEYVRDQYLKAKAAGKLDSFYQELMLRITSDEERLIRDNDIKWYEGEDVDEMRHSYNFYITTDFATSTKNTADYRVISVWAYNNNEDWMLHDGYLSKETMDAVIDRLFDFVVKYDIKQVGIEVSGQQGAFATWVRKEMTRRNIYFTLLEVKPVSDKITRLHNIVPKFRQGKIWFNKTILGSEYMTETLNEIKRATVAAISSRHDDVLDTVSMLSYMKPWRPQKVDTKGDHIDPFMDESNDDRPVSIGSYII